MTGAWSLVTMITAIHVASCSAQRLQNSSGLYNGPDPVASLCMVLMINTFMSLVNVFA
jgi:hypothetical protein